VNRLRPAHYIAGHTDLRTNDDPCTHSSKQVQAQQSISAIQPMEQQAMTMGFMGSIETSGRGIDQPIKIFEGSALPLRAYLFGHVQ